MIRNMKVGPRLFLLIGFMAMLIIAIGVLGLWATASANRGLETVYNDRVVPLRQLKTIADMYAVNIVDTTHKARNGNITFPEAIKMVDQAVSTIDTNWKAYLATELVPEERQLVEKGKPMMIASDAAVAKLKQILVSGDKKALTSFSINEMYPVIDPISGVFSEFVEVQLTVAKAEYDASAARYQTTRNISIASIVLGLILVSLFGFFIVRGIVKPLRTAAGLADQLAGGVLSDRAG